MSVGEDITNTRSTAAQVETVLDTKPVARRRGRPPKPKKQIPFIDGIPKGLVIEVSLEDINLDDTEFEFRVDQKLKDLMEDIAKNGQQFPVILRRPGKAEKYQIISGFRRCRTLKALDWPTAKAIVRNDLDDDEAFRISFMENEKRRSLTGVDKANAIVKLRIRGKNDEEIQELYGIGQRQVERYKQVSTFPSELRDAIVNEQILTTHGLALNKVYNAWGKDKVNLHEWIARIEHEDLSVRKLTRLLNQKFGKPKNPKRYMDKFKDGGFRLFPMSFDPEKTTPAAKHKMLGHLKDALERLEKGES